LFEHEAMYLILPIVIVIGININHSYIPYCFVQWRCKLPSWERIAVTVGPRECLADDWSTTKTNQSH
jgi:hypothetical protein